MAIPLSEIPGARTANRGKPGYLARDVESSGLELAYVEFTANVTITATSEASATTIVTAPALDLDGQAILVEFFCPRLDVADTADDVLITLWDGSTDLGRLGWHIVTGADLSFPVHLARKITPSKGQHTYSVRGWKVGAGSAVANAGTGTAGSLLAGFIRVTRSYTQREE